MPKIIFVMSFLLCLTACSSRYLINTPSASAKIDKRLIGNWKGSEINQQFEGITKYWRIQRNNDGTYDIEFEYITFENDIEVFRTRNKESGKWWIKNGLYHEISTTSDTGTPEVYKFKFLNKKQVKFNLVKSDMDFNVSIYSFIDTKVLDGDTTLEVSNEKDSPEYVEISRVPEFDGGEQALIDYLSRNIKFPKEASQNNIEGIVYISFVIDRDGSITNVQTVKGIGYGCDKEAVRVVKNMPNWIPGEHNGKKIRIEYSIPISFVKAPK